MRKKKADYLLSSRERKDRWRQRREERQKKKNSQNQVLTKINDNIWKDLDQTLKMTKYLTIHSAQDPRETVTSDTIEVFILCQPRTETCEYLQSLTGSPDFVTSGREYCTNKTRFLLFTRECKRGRYLVAVILGEDLHECLIHLNLFSRRFSDLHPVIERIKFARVYGLITSENREESKTEWSMMFMNPKWGYITMVPQLTVVSFFGLCSKSELDCSSVCNSELKSVFSREFDC
jgi:hypothetical protein